MLSCNSSLYILDKSLLSKIRSVNVFLFCGCLFTFLHLDLWRLRRTENHHIHSAQYFISKPKPPSTDCTSLRCLYRHSPINTEGSLLQHCFHSDLTESTDSSAHRDSKLTRLCDMRRLRCFFHLWLYTMLYWIFFTKYALLWELFWSSKKHVSPSEIKVKYQYTIYNCMHIINKLYKWSLKV